LKQVIFGLFLHKKTIPRIRLFGRMLGVLKPKLDFLGSYQQYIQKMNKDILNFAFTDT
jgi:hypothetical protein